MKRKSTLYTSLALCSLLLASCSDKDIIDNGSPLPEGTEIQFGCVLEDVRGSRTYYDPEDVANGSATYWRIYWNYPDNLDKIFIYSPQADAAHNQSAYTVNPGGTNVSMATDVRKDQPIGIRAGSTDGSYNFYALYPASAVSGAATGQTINASFSGRQNVTFANETGSEGSKVYTYEADMTNCLMTATNTVEASTLAGGVSLQFVPFASVLNIEVNGPNKGDGITVSSLQIESDNKISGKFAVDFSGSEPAVVVESSYETLTADKRLYISLDKPQLLKPGDKLRVRAFILPNEAVRNLTVTVTSNTARSWGKNLKMDSFKPKQIQSCKLPMLDPSTGKYDYAIWLSQLPPETFISEISLPGAALSFNTVANKVPADLQTQTIDVQNLFEAGVRVFQTHITLSPTPSVIDGGPSFMLTSNTTPLNMTLYNALQILTREMTVNHGDEFCVLILSDYGWGHISADKEAEPADFYKRLQVITNYPEFKDKLITELTPNTTIADVRGKIFLKYQLNISGFNTDQTTVEDAISHINAWAPLHDSNVAFNWWVPGVNRSVGYSPIIFSNVGETVAIRKASSSSTTKPGFLGSPDRSSLIFRTAERKWDSAKWGRDHLYGKWGWYDYGKIDMITRPRDYYLGQNMWFIYGEEANAGNNQGIAKANITNMVNAINSTYKRNAHNKFYMTYCGGASNGMSLETMTNDFNTTWTNAIKGKTDMPWGWVMLNDVGSNQSTNAIITKIIEHNSPADGFTPATTSSAR